MARRTAATPRRAHGSAAPPAAGAPVKLSRPDDHAATTSTCSSRARSSCRGIQALVRVLLDQHRADRARGPEHRRRSSPATRARRSAASTRRSCASGELAAEHALHFTPGPQRGARRDRRLRLAARAEPARRRARRRDRRLVRQEPGPRPRDGRAAPRELRRHASRRAARSRSSATTRRCKSSTLPSAGEATLASLHMPTFFPGTLQEVLDLGLHAIACSRASGLWSALKIVTNVADARRHRAGVARARRAGHPDGRVGGPPVPPPAQRQPARARRRSSSSARSSAPRLEIARQYARAQPAQPDHASRRATPGSGSSPRARSTTSSSRRCATSASTSATSSAPASAS